MHNQVKMSDRKSIFFSLISFSFCFVHSQFIHFLSGYRSLCQLNIQTTNWFFVGMPITFNTYFDAPLKSKISILFVRYWANFQSILFIMLFTCLFTCVYVYQCGLYGMYVCMCACVFLQVKVIKLIEMCCDLTLYGW